MKFLILNNWSLFFYAIKKFKKICLKYPTLTKQSTQQNFK